MTYNPLTDHNKPTGLSQYVTDGATRRARGLNSGRLWNVDGKRLKLTEVVTAAGGRANMNAARRDIVNGVLSAQEFVNKYRNRTQGNNGI